MPKSCENCCGEGGFYELSWSQPGREYEIWEDCPACNGSGLVEGEPELITEDELPPPREEGSPQLDVEPRTREQACLDILLITVLAVERGCNAIGDINTAREMQKTLNKVFAIMPELEPK